MDGLNKAWLNELAAPEILRFEADLVKDTLDKLEQQTETYLRSTEEESAAQRSMAHILQLEVDRIRFSLTSYLKVRLRKIEKHARFIDNTPELHIRLSTAELNHLKAYLDITDKCLQSILLCRLPEHLRGLSEPDMKDEPDLDQYVFTLIEDAVGTVEDNQERIDLARNDLIAIKYRTVQQLVLQHRARLL